MTILDASQQEALEKPVVHPLYFVMFDFVGGVIRMTNHSETLSWGGFEWIGMSTIGDVSAIEETNGVSSRPMNFSIRTMDSTMIALSQSPSVDYQGRSARLYFVPLDENFNMIGTPKLRWMGEMDNMLCSVDKGGTGAIVIKCESIVYSFKRRSSLRQNKAQLQAAHPEAKGMDHQIGLMHNKYVWVSRRFQRI